MMNLNDVINIINKVDAPGYEFNPQIDKCPPIRKQYAERSSDQQEAHRKLGRLQLMDIDCLETDDCNPFLEFNGKKPSAIVDFKNPGEQIDLYRLNILISIADACNVPAYISTYFKKERAYHIYCMNDKATEFFTPYSNKTKSNFFFTEKQYAILLHKLRGFKVPKEALSSLKNELPESIENWQPNIIKDKYNNSI